MRNLAVSALVASVATACSTQVGTPDRALDLLRSFPDAEIASDRLSLADLAPHQRFRPQGWVELSEGGGEVLWSRRLEAQLTLRFFTTSPKLLSIRARSLPALESLPVDVVLNEAHVGSFRASPAPGEFRLRLPGTFQRPGLNVLTLRVPRRYEPREGDAEPWPRAIALLGLDVRPEGASGGSAGPRAGKGAVVLPAASRIGYYEQVPRGTRLIAELGSAAGERARVVFAAANDGERIAFGGADVEGRSVTVSAPLPDLEGPIRLDVENFGGGAVRLHGLRLELPAADPGADLGVPTAEGSPSTRPDVILYLTDTLRADALGAYGAAGDPSPAFDRFASEGLLVEDFRAQSSWTQPAVASILTGLHPGSHGVDEARDVLVPELATLAELLKQAGYATAAFVSNHVVNARRGFTQGFDAWNDDDPSLYGAPAARLVERALAWRDRTEGPAFLYVHTMEPHWPYAPEEEDWRSFRPPDYRGERDPQKLLDRQAELSPGEVAYLRSLYLGAVRQNDRAFAELLDGLEGRGTLDESLVLFTADHGEEFREHGGLMHRFTLYEEVLRIPLAIRFPVAVAGGFRDPGPADQVDLFPSIVGLLGLPAVDDLDGIDHSARWRRAAGAPSPRELIATLHNGRLVRAMIRRGRHKLIAGSDPEAPGVERLELYDLAADPGEQNDLAEDHPIAAAYLERRIRSLQRELALSRERRRAGAELALSEQEAKDLRALGYVE